MDNSELSISGGIGEDGVFVINREESSSGWTETIKVGKLKIRGESKPRTISYSDYALLNTFYATQERLIRDRKHIQIRLSNGSVVNTADITSLDLAEEERFIKRETTDSDRQLQKLPTSLILLDSDFTPITDEHGSVQLAGKHNRPIDREHWFIGKCHYKHVKVPIPDGGTADVISYIAGDINKIAETIKLKWDEELQEAVVCPDGHYKYGLEIEIANHE